MVSRKLALVAACLTGSAVWFIDRIWTEEPGNTPRFTDIGKRFIERPVGDFIAAAGGIDDRKFENPKVEPGLVRWHRDFSSACKASGSSGKPVLLFHLLGRLDDRFC